MEKSNLCLSCTIKIRFGDRKEDSANFPGFKEKNLYFWVDLSLSLLTTGVILLRGPRLGCGPGVCYQGSRGLLLIRAPEVCPP